MIFFHTFELSEFPKRDDPLYVGHYYYSLKGMRGKKRLERQQIVFSVAFAWYKVARRQIKSPGMLTEEMILTGLTSKVREARSIIEHFFTITKLGFNFNDGTNFGPTIVSPKKLPDEYVHSIEQHLNRIVFHPGPKPADKKLVQSVVKVHQENASNIFEKLEENGRTDLAPAVKWILEHEELTFFYKPAGRLQARDVSVWPIRAIEAWPGWLRTDLFGTTVDIENSFCQFLVSHLERHHIGKERVLRLKFPDLLRAVYDKQAFREELCRDVLRQSVSDEAINAVKSLVMALANGSNCSPGLMAVDAQSEAVRIVKKYAPDLTSQEMIEIGFRLQRIAQQFRSAKRELCLYLLGATPTRQNVKRIFEQYFDWERESRYKIWNATGRTGLMLHDGIDGVITEMTEDELTDHIARETSLRVSVEM